MHFLMHALNLWRSHLVAQLNDPAHFLPIYQNLSAPCHQPHIIDIIHKINLTYQKRSPIITRLYYTSCLKMTGDIYIFSGVLFSPVLSINCMFKYILFSFHYKPSKQDKMKLLWNVLWSHWNDYDTSKAYTGFFFVGQMYSSVILFIITIVFTLLAEVFHYIYIYKNCIYIHLLKKKG